MRRKRPGRWTRDVRLRGHVGVSKVAATRLARGRLKRLDTLQNFRVGLLQQPCRKLMQHSANVLSGLVQNKRLLCGAVRLAMQSLQRMFKRTR